MSVAASLAGVSLIRSGNIHALHEFDSGRLRFVQVLAFTGTGDVVRASYHRLHPPQPRITSRTDLLRRELLRRQFDELVSSLVQEQLPIPASRTHRFAIPWHIAEAIVHRDRSLSKRGVTGSL